MVTGLIGPNGAGKTTMFNVITGLQQPDQGKIWLDGADVTASSARVRARLGIGRTFQRLEVFGSLSVRDNVLVALEAKHGIVRRSKRRARAEELLSKVGLAEEAGVLAGTLPTGSGRLLELARSLAYTPRMLLLDEVSSGLDTQESQRVGELLHQLAAEGMAVLMVEHDMEMVMSLCQQVHVLDFGELIASGTPAEIQMNPSVQAAYLGTEDISIAVPGALDAEGL
jgi:branched-chain amino acid transport system ATP-binding protein